MSAGVGIDLIEVDRIERALQRYPRLAGRLFSDDELAYCSRHGRPARHLAARFAAKEAAVKALGLDHFTPRSIEVVEGRPPTLRLHGRAAELARERRVELSLSLTHAREIAAAVVVADAA